MPTYRDSGASRFKILPEAWSEDPESTRVRILDFQKLLVTADSGTSRTRNLRCRKYQHWERNSISGEPDMVSADSGLMKLVHAG